MTTSRENILASILSEESYRPGEPESLADLGLPASLIEGLVLKRLSIVGNASGRSLSEHICVPFRLLNPLLQTLRNRQLIVHQSSAPLNDYRYGLTEVGREMALDAMKTCSYVGPAPVPLSEYILAAEAQSIRGESPRRAELRQAFADITIDEELFDCLGPAINSGTGLFLYGQPGNGKSTLAQRITQCFGQDVWIPHVLIEDGQLIKLFDAAVHQISDADEAGLLTGAAYDRRWVKVRRPTVIVGGELTMENLEIRYDPISNTSEAPVQLKSNCGCLLIDDFGRQRIDPAELLNRWIVPLESRYDFLTLANGKKIQVPFEQLIIFSTNLEPEQLVDEAFLRRIPYKVEIANPTVDEYHELFEIYCARFDCEYRPDVVDELIRKHYHGAGRSLRRCHPRDMLQQIRNLCVYNELPMEMRDEYFDRIVRSYFPNILPTDSPAAVRPDAAPATQPPNTAAATIPTGVAAAATVPTTSEPATPAVPTPAAAPAPTSPIPTPVQPAPAASNADGPTHTVPTPVTPTPIVPTSTVPTAVEPAAVKSAAAEPTHTVATPIAPVAAAWPPPAPSTFPAQSAQAAQSAAQASMTVPTRVAPASQAAPMAGATAPDTPLQPANPPADIQTDAKQVPVSTTVPISIQPQTANTTEQNA